jgi:hypothetical protein
VLGALPNIKTDPWVKTELGEKSTRRRFRWARAFPSFDLVTFFVSAASAQSQEAKPDFQSERSHNGDSVSSRLSANQPKGSEASLLRIGVVSEVPRPRIFL